jgi:hypothetical protein
MSVSDFAGLRIFTMETANLSPPTVRRPTGRAWLLAGVALALLGPVLYYLQLAVARLVTVPWYLPVVGTAAAVLALVAVRRGRTVWRLLGLVFCVLLAGLEWFIVLTGARLPAYAGPVAVGQPFPAFAVTRSDGGSFTQEDLRGEQNTVLVFFRGRW